MTLNTQRQLNHINVLQCVIYTVDSNISCVQSCNIWFCQQPNSTSKVHQYTQFTIHTVAQLR